MKLTHITAQNYLGARAVDLAITTPIMLIAGKNGAGKSSLQEAIRHAIGGDAARVALKKDFKALPAGLPEAITPVWIEGGIAGEMREAA